MRCMTENVSSPKRGTVGLQRLKESAIPGMCWGDRCTNSISFSGKLGNAESFGASRDHRRIKGDVVSNAFPLVEGNVGGEIDKFKGSAFSKGELDEDSDTDDEGDELYVDEDERDNGDDRDSEFDELDTEFIYNEEDAAVQIEGGATEKLLSKGNEGGLSKEEKLSRLEAFCARVRASDGHTVTTRDIAGLYDFQFDKFQV